MPPRCFLLAKTSFLGLRRKLRGGYGEVGNSESGSLTVTARISNGSSRHAMPSMPELVYAALLYKDGNSPANPPSTNFVQGTATEDGKLNFSFQKPEDTSGTFTLEIFAFGKKENAADESATVFSRATALLSGSKDKCTIKGDKINVSEPIALSVNSLSEVKGTVSLKIKVPAECSLEIDDARFFVTGTSPDFIITQIGDGISSGAYQVTFTVKKGVEIVHIFSEYINVFPGMCTDTWNGLEKDGAKEITQSMISSTVYVRGEGGWYDTTSPYNDGETAEADDTNSGNFLSPLASIQKAVDTVIARNDGASEYTIYIDGKFTAASSAALADFSGVSKHLSVKIAGLDPSSLDSSTKAVIDGNNSARGIVVGSSSAQKDVNLALENLVIQNTKNSDRGGGITLYCTAGNSHTIKNCVIKNNHAGYGSAIYNEYGLLDLQGCVISGNTADTSGTVYIGRESAILTMSDVSIENNSAKNGGGLFLAYDATAKISDVSVVIRNNSIGSSSRGVGICLWNGRLELSGSAKIDDVVEFPNERDSITHEVVVAGDLTAASPVATITPSSYSAGEKVLSANDVTTIQNICDKFAITPQADGTEWKIAPSGANGVLKVAINVYVRGSGEGWYTDNGHGDITGSDDNSGDRLHPFATIQKAVAAVKNLNDGETECTIYVDGTVTQETASSSAMVYLSSLNKNLTLTIKSLSETKRATLDANNLTTAVDVSRSNIDLAIENLILCNGKDNDYGLYLSGYGVTATFVLSGCEISGNRKGGINIRDAGTFAIENCEIINNSGRGVSLGSCPSGTITGSKIKNNTDSYAAGLYVSNTVITIKDCEISGNTSTSSGGGIELFNGGSGYSLIMEDCVVSGNSANEGGGIYLNGGFSLTMKGSKSKISENVTTGTSSDGGGVYSKGTFTMEDGEISGNNATRYGGGVYVGGGTFIMNGGKITGNTATEKGGGVYEKSSDTFTKNGGTINGNSPNDVYEQP
ncbi:MAG: right-handed parallel beta-helix repeat-containing protein [Treponemataceae bacterium]|nr:right-handed parallel beta-helix repeat-containing protein [Treponemataceae bacterium]